MSPTRWFRPVSLALGFAGLLSACSYDRTDRWLKGAEPPPPECQLGQGRCAGSRLERCVSAIGGPAFELEDDCGARGQQCNPNSFECSPCIPGVGSCDGLDAYICDETGQGRVLQGTCEPEKLEGCRAGKCVASLTMFYEGDGS